MIRVLFSSLSEMLDVFAINVVDDDDDVCLSSVPNGKLVSVNVQLGKWKNRLEGKLGRFIKRFRSKQPWANKLIRYTWLANGKYELFVVCAVDCVLAAKRALTC